MHDNPRDYGLGGKSKMTATESAVRRCIAADDIRAEAYELIRLLIDEIRPVLVDCKLTSNFEVVSPKFKL